MADSQSYSSRLSDDGSLLAMWKEHRSEGIANCGGQDNFWQKASRLKRFAARDQWPEKDRQKLDNPNRKSARLTIPETSRVLAAFSGRQVLSRMERGYIPYNQDSSRHAEIWTKVDRALCQACDGEQVDSAAFRDGPGIQGVSWVRWYVDDWSAEKPQLKYETIPIWQMMWPPTRKLNLQDRAWQRWGSWWPQSTVRSRWQKSYDKIKMLIGARQWTDVQQSANQSSRIPWTGGAGNKPYNAADAYDPKTRSFWIEYEEWREMVTYFEVSRPIDPQMSYEESRDLNSQRIMMLADEATKSMAPPDPEEVVEMSSDELKSFRKERQAVFSEDVPNDAIARKQRMIYRYAYGCGDEILETGDLETKCFTFQAMAAEVVELEDKTLYIGLLEDLEDAQKMVNFMMSALIRDLQINPKGVLFIEQGLFRDRNEALTAFTSPGGVVEIPRGRMVGAQGQRPWEFVSGGTNAYSSKLESMLAFYREAIPRLAGFNPAALGQLGTDIRRVSGEVVRQLTDATMTSNAERMDSYRLYRREGARILLAFARMLWEPEDLVRYIGESDAYDDVLGEDGMPTGEKTLAIPPKEMWREDAWKEIAIEEVQPSDSELSAFWDTVQTQVQLLQSPMPDTGKPLFEAIDWVQLFPKMPAALRQKMIARIKMQQKAFQLQQQQQQQQQQAEQQAQAQGQIPPPGAEQGQQPTGEMPVQ